MDAGAPVLAGLLWRVNKTLVDDCVAEGACVAELADAGEAGEAGA